MGTRTCKRIYGYEIDNIKVSGNKISFSASLSGMDDTQPDDIKMRLEEYLTMTEAAGPIIIKPT